MHPALFDACEPVDAEELADALTRAGVGVVALAYALFKLRLSVDNFFLMFFAAIDAESSVLGEIPVTLAGVAVPGEGAHADALL